MVESSHIGYEIGSILCKGQFLLSYDYIVFFSAHPFLFVCVFGHDHVTCYVGADVNSGENADA